MAASHPRFSDSFIGSICSSVSRSADHRKTRRQRRQDDVIAAGARPYSSASDIAKGANGFSTRSGGQVFLLLSDAIRVECSSPSSIHPSTLDFQRQWHGRSSVYGDRWAPTTTKTEFTEGWSVVFAAARSSHQRFTRPTPIDARANRCRYTHRLAPFIRAASSARHRRNRSEIGGIWAGRRVGVRPSGDQSAASKQTAIHTQSQQQRQQSGGAGAAAAVAAATGDSDEGSRAET